MINLIGHAFGHGDQSGSQEDYNGESPVSTEINPIHPTHSQHGHSEEPGVTYSASVETGVPDGQDLTGSASDGEGPTAPHQVSVDGEHHDTLDSSVSNGEGPSASAEGSDDSQHGHELTEQGAGDVQDDLIGSATDEGGPSAPAVVSHLEAGGQYHNTIDSTVSNGEGPSATAEGSESSQGHELIEHDAENGQDDLTGPVSGGEDPVGANEVFGGSDIEADEGGQSAPAEGSESSQQSHEIIEVGEEDGQDDLTGPASDAEDTTGTAEVSEDPDLEAGGQHDDISDSTISNEESSFALPAVSEVSQQNPEIIGQDVGDGQNDLTGTESDQKDTFDDA